MFRYFLSASSHLVMCVTHISCLKLFLQFLDVAKCGVYRLLSNYLYTLQKFKEILNCLK